MTQISGGCYCGNITYTGSLSKPVSSFTPRACDCDFCSLHGASYISDNEGSLSIAIQSEEELNRFRQGSQLVDFLICRTCGVVIGACYDVGDERYGAINARTLHQHAELGKQQISSPKALPDKDKIDRWKALWFPHLRIVYGIKRTGEPKTD